MNAKTCFKCSETKPLDEFYKHSQMPDGHLNKCKECTKKDVRQNRSSKRGKYSDYEKIRRQNPKRRENQLAYQRTKRMKSPEKYKAYNIVNNAIRDGKLIRKPCKVCGTAKVQAHHRDYNKPLEVEWLCFKHHREIEHGQVVVSNF